MAAGHFSAAGFHLMRHAHGAVSLEYGILGAGTPVLLLPGRGGAATEQFAELGRHLAEAGFCAVALNPRGVGNSTGTLEALTLHDYAADAAAVITARGGPVHVVGRAFGGRIARCLAADSPADVLSVTAIAAGGRYAGGARPRPGNGAHAFEPPRFKVWRAAGAAQRRAAASTPLDDWWSGGRAPMLVVQGLEDTIAPPQNGRALHLADPDRVRLVEVPDAGHGVLFERPDVVVPAVLEFLRAVEAARGSPSSG